MGKTSRIISLVIITLGLFMIVHGITQYGLAGSLEAAFGIFVFVAGISIPIINTVRSPQIQETKP